MKWLLIGFFALISLTSLAEENASAQKVSRDSLTHYAKQFIGIPYKYGGSSTSGFDCSGFVHYVFSHFKIDVPRSSRDYKHEGNKVEKAEANPGDVILFTGTNSSIREIGHVGIVLQNNDGIIDFIHSSSSSNHWGVTITRFNESGYVKRFMGIVNLLS
jgi:cell wall-associated NlpC family hydrolase